MKWIKWCSIVYILIGLSACILFGCKLIDLGDEFQHYAILGGSVFLVSAFIALGLSKVPKFRNKVIMSEIDEREVFIKYKSGYIAGWFLCIVIFLFVLVLEAVSILTEYNIPSWVMLCLLFIALLYEILYFLCIYFMRNKK